MARQSLVYLRSDVRGLKTTVLMSNSLRDLRRKITTLAGKNTGAVTLFRWDDDAQRRGDRLSEDDMDSLLVDLGIMGTSVFVAQGAGELCVAKFCSCVRELQIPTRRSAPELAAQANCKRDNGIAFYRPARRTKGVRNGSGKGVGHTAA